ncbi:hypothetical protein PSEUBRA_000893 [Kalmanozyma brasiliensis GHG001]|uniref:Uncharacterized protein n=1 Tax=Kalmanozyma brasiliensis (strain GHG001) TaxID=1365824 RepID=V5GTR1_KALBG|nr:uncharacterized protein PSEUBRA_000893 [Kalmanozyma brasiliensis GHG001]EST09302.1 hypothetical protein PSEUBRA_000893 [Kalmanozyma brasiliensis GHG001]
MRFEQLLLVCLACLSLTVHAAPASVKDLHRSHDSHPKPAHDRHRPRKNSSSRHRRALNTDEIHAAEEASHLLPSYREKYAAAEVARREQLKLKLHQMQVEDSIHMAKYGSAPPKFPLITRIASTIGLSSAVFNVVNFMYSAKTTALATDQFSAPPTPPTLIDSAARWDGKEYRLLPLPEDNPKDGGSGKKKRSLPNAPVEGKMEKRWVVSSIVGAGLGAAFAPGFTGALMNKKPDVDKPPFDPYDESMLKPKDAFAAAAADSSQPLPAVQSTGPSERVPAASPPELGAVVFPGEPISERSFAADTRPAPNTGFTAPDNAPVLRKRSLSPSSFDSSSPEERDLRKRFLFMGGPWSKVAGALTVGSVVPLLYEGVTHARWRTYNPRDRDVLKDLDDTPTYGAVGVPGRQPGQLATNAMPGYAKYLTELEQGQAQAQGQQQASPMAAGSRLATNEGAGPVIANAETTLSDAQPVLRRSLDKRGNLMMAGGLAAFGLALGYAQSATQFPTDRDEERDERKRKLKKAQEAQQQAMAQQQGMQQGAGSQVDPLAGIPVKPLPDGSGGDPLAGMPVKPLPGGGGDDPLAGVPVRPLPGSDAGSDDTSGNAPNSAGPTSPNSAASSLNAAAGLQTNLDTSSPVLKKRTDSLTKRTPGMGSALSIGGTAMFFGTLAGNLFVSAKQKSKPVPVVTPNADTKGPMIPGGELYTQFLESRRGPTGASAGGVGQGAMADVSRVAAPVAAPAAAAVGSMGSGAGSDLTWTPTSNGGFVPVRTDSSSSDDTSADPVLRKRRASLLKRAPLAFAAAAEAGEASAILSKAPALLEAEAGLASLGGGAAAEAGTAASGAGRLSGLSSEAGALSRSGSAGRLTRFGSAGRGAAAEAGAVGRGAAATEALTLGRTAEGGLAVYRPNPASWGSAKPAMIENAAAVGGEGVPATIEGVTKEKGKGMSWKTALGIVSGGAGASMTFNGPG